MNLVCPECGATNRVPGERLRDQPVCGKCGNALMAPAPVALGEDRLPKFLERTELPVLVDYWAAWCGPCQMMAPEFAKAAQAAPMVRFVKVDTEAAPAAAARAGIRSLPTVVLYRGGRELARHSGATNAAGLGNWLRQHLGQPA
jgi:thioredoxin 2